MEQRLESSDYKALKKALGRGGIKQVHILFNQKLKEANEAEVSYELVSFVLRGEQYRQDIIDFAIEYARKLKEEKRETLMLTSNKIKELVHKS